MKIFLYAVLLTIVLTACKKNHIDLPSCSTAPNTIAITDNGTTYCIAGNGLRINPTNVQNDQNNVGAICYASNTNSFLQFEGDGPAFSIEYFNDFGPPHGVGVFLWPTIMGTYARFTEKFPGGKTYNVTGGNVIVTKADSMHIQATFAFNLSDGLNAKTITGSISTTKP